MIFLLFSASVSWPGVVKWGPAPLYGPVLDPTDQTASSLLLWVRIRADLASYLVDRGADGAQVTCWYHRQSVQAAQARYLSESSERERLHSAIALISCGEILLVSQIVQHLISPHTIGSITSRCSGNEPALLPRTSRGG